MAEQSSMSFGPVTIGGQQGFDSLVRDNITGYPTQGSYVDVGDRQGALGGVSMPDLIGSSYLQPGLIAESVPPIADPVYAKATDQSVMLARIEPITQTYLNVRRDIIGLRDDFTTPASGREQALIDRITTFVRDHVDADAEKPELPRFFPGFLNDAGEFAIRDLDALTEIDPDADDATSQSALFDTGKVMVRDIRTSDRLRYGLSRMRRDRQRRLTRLREQLADLEQRLPEERNRLATLERARIEALGDYSVAQRLVAEDWAAVESAFEARRRVLEGHRGLYYVRVRETPVSARLPDPLALRHVGRDDLVPGCAPRSVDLPDALAAFIDDVLEVPLADWAAFDGLHHLLPGRDRLARLVRARRRHLELRREQDAGAGASSALLAPLRAQVKGFSAELLGRPFAPTGSLLQVQRAGSRILSLQDLLAGPPHRLRGRAQQLQQRLDTAAGCLLERLRAITPSLRLDWAAAAEDDRLPIEAPEQWPGLERAEAADFNGVRTLIELIQWWVGQLQADAAAGSRTALRNLVRAVVLVAARDDPEQILRGSVKTGPAAFSPGSNLRLSLTREALPGTRLQLLDASQRVVGTLRVDDNDDGGAIASVLDVFDATAAPDGSYSVAGIVETLKL